MLTSRGGKIARVTLPDGKVIRKRCEGREFTHVVICHHKVVGWGWFRFCESEAEAQQVRDVDVPASQAAWGFTEVRIVPCEMVHPWEDTDAPPHHERRNRMANWKYKINLKEEWKAAQAGEMTIQQLAQRVRHLLGRLPVAKTDATLAALIEDFQGIVDDPYTDADDFDEVWAQLYDWGDTVLEATWPTTKLCWIGTF